MIHQLRMDTLKWKEVIKNNQMEILELKNTKATGQAQQQKGGDKEDTELEDIAIKNTQT